MGVGFNQNKQWESHSGSQELSKHSEEPSIHVNENEQGGKNVYMLPSFKTFFLESPWLRTLAVNYNLFKSAQGKALLEECYPLPGELSKQAWGSVATKASRS